MRLTAARCGGKVSDIPRCRSTMVRPPPLTAGHAVPATAPSRSQARGCR